MELISKEALLDEFMNFMLSGRAESVKDCAEFNSMIKDAPPVEIYKQDEDSESVVCPGCKHTIYKPFIRCNDKVVRYDLSICPLCGESL